MTIDPIHAVCGPKCTQCPAYEATRSGDPKQLAAVAAEWSQALGKEVAPEDIVCDGCRVENGRKSAYWQTCEIRLCAHERGHDICAACEQCPCEKIVAPPAREALDALKQSIGKTP
jgi:hypothetical protein